MKPKSKRLKIQLVRSLIGRREKHRRTVRALGLRKLNSVVYHNPSPQIRGMIKQVAYLLKVEEVKGNED